MSTEMSLSDRMKDYEKISDNRLVKKQPVIIRLDGRAFHTFTKGLTKPFDTDLSDAFQFVCEKLSKEIQGVKLVYTQSDEISILLTDWDKITTDAWFDYRIQKMVSLSAAMCTLYFNEYIKIIIEKYWKLYNQKDIEYKEEQQYLEKYRLWKTKCNKAMFDARCFNLPVSEVCNYFIYRQQDAIRNATQSLAQAYFSHKELDKKNTKEQIEMVKDKSGIDFNELSLRQQRGFCIYKYEDKEQSISEFCLDQSIPIFTENREYIEKYV